MDTIQYKTDETFPYKELSLLTPKPMQGGSFFSKIIFKDGKSLLFQTPLCGTKSGIIKTDKKIYCDLLLSEIHESFIKWFEKLEHRLHELIFENSNTWFHNEITIDDIEYLFNSCLRTYKSSNTLIRCFVKQPKYIKNKNVLQVFDEFENNLNLDDVTKDKQIISIIEVLGIKFTNGGASFHVDLCVRQMMVFSKKNEFKKCLIQHQQKNEDVKEESEKIEDEVLGDVKEESEKIEEDVKKESEKIEDVKEESEKIEEDVKKESEKIEDVKKESEKIEDVKEESEKIEDVKEESEKIEKMDVKTKVAMGNNELEQEDQPKLVDKNTLETLTEIDINEMEVDDTIKLCDPKEVYYKMWKEARRVAKEAKQKAIKAYLEAKKIKNTYLLEDLDSSDDEDLDNLLE